MNYEAPNDPTFVPSQVFSGPNGQQLSISVAEDPRTTAGVAFGATDTIDLNATKARFDGGTLRFVPCAGVLVSINAPELSTNELAALAGSVTIAIDPSPLPDFVQERRPCPTRSQ